MNAIQNPVLIEPPNAQVLPAVWKPFRMRLRITYNSFRHAKLRRKIGTLILYLGLAGFGYFIFWLSQILLRFVRSPKWHNIPGWISQPFLLPFLPLS